MVKRCIFDCEFVVKVMYFRKYKRITWSNTAFPIASSLFSPVHDGSKKTVTHTHTHTHIHTHTGSLFIPVQTLQTLSQALVRAQSTRSIQPRAHPHLLRARSMRQHRLAHDHVLFGFVRTHAPLGWLPPNGRIRRDICVNNASTAWKISR